MHHELSSSLANSLPLLSWAKQVLVGLGFHTLCHGLSHLFGTVRLKDLFSFDGLLLTVLQRALLGDGLA